LQLGVRRLGGKQHEEGVGATGGHLEWFVIVSTTSWGTQDCGAGPLVQIAI